jgi:hypothetical protein
MQRRNENQLTFSTTYSSLEHKEWKSTDFLSNLQQLGIQNESEEWKFCRGIPARIHFQVAKIKLNEKSSKQ